MKLADIGKVTKVGDEVLRVAAVTLERIWPGAKLVQFTVQVPNGPQGVSFELNTETNEYEVSM